MSCAPGFEFLVNSGAPEDAPKYACCYCGGTFTATEADIAAACGAAAEAGAVDLADTVAFEDYGRDVCDACALRFSAAPVVAPVVAPAVEPLPTRAEIDALISRVRTASAECGASESRERHWRFKAERMQAEQELAAALSKWERALPKAAA